MQARLVLFLTLTSVGLRAQTPPAPAAAPDVLTFANGERLVGHLLRAHGSKVTFKSDSLGEITVEWSKIQELRTSEPFVVLEKKVQLNRHSDLAKVPQGTVVMESQKITVTPATGTPETIPTADTAHLIDRPAFEHDVLHNPGFFEAWTGAVTAGATLVEATQKGRTFTGGINLVRAVPTENWLSARNRTLFNFSVSDGVLSQPNTPKLKNEIVHADLERDQYFDESNVFAFARAAFDHNYSQGLDLQQNYGGGIGWTAVKRPNSTLDLKGSVSYTKEQFATADHNQNLVGSVFEEDYAHKFAKGVQFLQQLAITPAWNNTNAYAATANASLTVPVYKRLAFAISSIDSFLNNPPPGFKKNSFQLTTGLTYTLK